MLMPIKLLVSLTMVTLPDVTVIPLKQEGKKENVKLRKREEKPVLHGRNKKKIYIKQITRTGGKKIH